MLLKQGRTYRLCCCYEESILRQPFGFHSPRNRRVPTPPPFPEASMTGRLNTQRRPAACRQRVDGLPHSLPTDVVDLPWRCSRIAESLPQSGLAWPGKDAGSWAERATGRYDKVHRLHLNVGVAASRGSGSPHRVRARLMREAVSVTEAVAWQRRNEFPSSTSDHHTEPVNQVTGGSRQITCVVVRHSSCHHGSF